MSERVLEIISGDKRRFFGSSLEERTGLNVEGATPVPSILGVGDVALDVPGLEQRIELPSAHQGFFVARLSDTLPKGQKPTHDDPRYYNFEVTGPTGIKIPVQINSIFTNCHEENYSQIIDGLVYLGVGGLVFMTDEKEFYTLFGPSLEHRTFFDLGYRSTENIRAYSSKKPTDHIKSFGVPNGKYVIVNDLDYVVIHNTVGFPPEAQGKVASRAYPIYNVDGRPRIIGNIPEPEDRGTLSPLVCENFQGLVPLPMDSTVYILQMDKGRIKVYEIQKMGTPQEKLAEVKEIGVPNAPTRVNLLQF